MISELVISKCQLFSPPDLRLISRTLKYFQISPKNVKYIPNDYFHDCNHLEIIGISNSKLQRVPNLNDTHRTRKRLHLSHNNISDICQLYGVLFPELNYLDLLNNKILAIETHLMMLPVISYVSLEGNCLVSVPDLTQSGWGTNLSEKKTVSIYMGYGNPWHCSADMLWVVDMICTVYPKKYAHDFVVLCFVVVMQSFIMNSHEAFIHIHQGCFAGTGAIVRLPQCQWSKPDGYGKISQCITTTKHSKGKTVCIFLGIYCTLTCTTKQPHRIEIADLNRIICSTPTDVSGKAIIAMGMLNHLFCGCERCNCSSKFVISRCIYLLMSCAYSVKQPWGKCYVISLNIT